MIFPVFAQIMHCIYKGSGNHTDMDLLIQWKASMICYHAFGLLDRAVMAIGHFIRPSGVCVSCFSVFPLVSVSSFPCIVIGRNCL